MIISHAHRFIFAAVPKTGTHSVRQALREQMGEEDVEQVILFVDKRFLWPDLAVIRHGHLALRQVRPFFWGGNSLTATSNSPLSVTRSIASSPTAPSCCVGATCFGIGRRM